MTQPTTSPEAQLDPVTTKRLMLLEAHACAASPEYSFACTISGAAERIGLLPSGKDFRERHRQTQLFMGELIERLKSFADARYNAGIAAERDRAIKAVCKYCAEGVQSETIPATGRFKHVLGKGVGEWAVCRASAIRTDVLER